MTRNVQKEAIKEHFEDGFNSKMQFSCINPIGPVLFYSLCHPWEVDSTILIENELFVSDAFISIHVNKTSMLNVSLHSMFMIYLYN